MSQRLKVIAVFTGVILVLFGLWVTDNFIYPLKAQSPNYSDVEAAFAKLQFPSDWVETARSENRGMFGRGCDMFNDSGCFHKSKTFKVPENMTNEQVKAFLIISGCPGVVVNEFTYDGETKKSFGFNCALSGGVQLGASLKGPESTLSVTAKTY